MRSFFSIVLCLCCFAAHAWPTKPVRLVVAYPPGGGIDVMARQIAEKLTPAWGQPVVVENKPGANTIVATDAVAKSPADGHTILLTTDATFSINPHLYAKLPFDTQRDFTPVTMLVLLQQLLVAHPSLPANNLSELISLAKAKPGAINYASYGSGSQPHLSGEMLKNKAGIDLVHVPYKGGAPAQQDVMGGRVPILLDVLYAVQPLIDAGKIKPIALLSPQRISSSPIPVVAETVPGVSALSIVGIVAAGGTGKDLVASISSDLSKAIKSSDLTERMTQLGMEPVGSTPAQFDALIRAEIEKWSRVVKASGAKVD
jgi:tripartite-type tricarboxylate transporter receptor subunit TctC